MKMRNNPTKIRQAGLQAELLILRSGARLKNLHFYQIHQPVADGGLGNMHCAVPCYVLAEISSIYWLPKS